jgi:aldose 1-epimerase
LTEGDGRGNAIHGFVLNRPWRVIEQTDRRVVGQFQSSVDDPDVLKQWPADFRITVSYELTGTELHSRLVVENPDTRPLPCGLGTHPYFRLPLGGSRGDACIVKLPVTSFWELDQMLPTGRELPLPEAASLRAGRAFGEMKYDTVMSGLEFAEGKCVTEINDPESGLVVRQSFDDTFRECVIYTPPHREAICIEPYTCVPGGFQLPTPMRNAGLRVLQPGASFQAVITIRADSMQS